MDVGRERPPSQPLLTNEGGYKSRIFRIVEFIGRMYQRTRISRLSREVFWIYLAQGMVALAGVVAVRVMTTFLPPGEYGLLSLVLVGEALGIGVVLGPLNNACLRFYNEMKVSGAHRTWLITLLTCYGGVWSILAILLGATIGTAWLVWRDSRLVLLAFLGLALLAGSTLRTSISHLLNVSRQQKLYSIAVTLDAWARPLSAMALMGVFGASGRMALLGYVLASWASGVVALKLFLRSGQADLKGPFVFSWSLALSMWSFGWPFIGMGLAAWMMGVFDRIILRFYYTNAEVGLYTAGYQAGSAFPQMLGMGFVLIVGPMLLQSQAWGRRYERDLGKAIGRMIVFMVPVVGLIFTFPELLVNLLIGKQYHSAQVESIVRIVAAAMLMSNLQLLAGYPFTLLKRTKMLVIIWIVSASIVLVLYAVLVPKMAGVGAAVATFAGFAFHMAITVWQGRRLLDWSIPNQEIVAAVLGVSLSAILNWGLGVAFPGMPGVARALVWLGTYGVVGLSVAYVFSDYIQSLAGTP